MTIEEKLDYCRKFIEKVNKMPFKKYCLEDIAYINDAYADSDFTGVNVRYPANVLCYDTHDIESLQDEAWHVLAEITE